MKLKTKKEKSGDRDIERNFFFLLHVYVNVMIFSGSNDNVYCATSYVNDNRKEEEGNFLIKFSHERRIED